MFGTGPKAGEAIVSHPDVPLISFTGSTLTGQLIMERSAPRCKKLSLELGGKNPAIIFEDADLDQCIPTTVRSSFANQVWENTQLQVKQVYSNVCVCLDISVTQYRESPVEISKLQLDDSKTI